MTQARDVADGKFTNTTLTIDSGSDNANTLLLSDGAADANIVDGFVTCRHHSSSEEPVLMIQGRSTSSENIVLIGGTHNNSTYNTATSIKFFTASGYTNTTPVEKMRVTGDGLTFNGDTAAANALDDYEEGTYTPVISATDGIGTLTYSAQVGRYTKVGNRVSFNAYLSIANKGTVAGSLRITLPFTVKNVANNNTVFSWWINSAVSGQRFDGDTMQFCFAGPNSSIANPYGSNGAGGVDLLNAAHVQNGTDFMVGGTYEV